MWRSTGLWFADCANPRLLRSPYWTPLMVSARWCDPLTQQLGSGGGFRSKPETTTGQLKPHSTAKSRFEIFSKSIRDLAGFRSVVVVTGSARISVPPHPHAPTSMADHIRDHRSQLRSARGSIPSRSCPSCGCRSLQNPIRSTLDK